MEVTDSSAQSIPAKVGGAVNDARESTISNFTDFLTLLTAQLKHQDPLQPLDSTKFVEQLATFAAVEQQVGANEKLLRLIEQGTATQMNELGGWIGRSVEADKALFALDEDGIRVSVPEDPNATSVQAVISEENGDEIARVDVTDADGSFTWLGRTANGRQLSSGNFGISFAYTYDGRGSTLLDAKAVGDVVEARIDDEGPILFLNSGAVVRPADVTALRIRSETEASAE